MKKLFLMLLAIALVGSFAFAEVTGVEAPSVSGSITTTFGYNLDLEASGFNNDASVDVVVPLAGGSATGAGSGGVYAEITISDIEISLSVDGEDGDDEVSYDASVSAKIVMGALYIGLGEPDLSFNAVELEDFQDFNANVKGTGGISLGYVTDAFSFEVGVKSKEDYSADDAEAAVAEEDEWYDTTPEEDASSADFANLDNNYLFGLNASITAGPAVVDVYAAYDPSYTAADALMGFGANVAADFGVATLDLGFDYVTVGDDYGMDLSAELGADVGVGTLTVNFLMQKWETVVPGLLEGDYMEAGLTFDAALADELTLVLGFTLEDLTADEMGWEATLEAAYDLGAVVPYLETGYDKDGVIPLTIGADFPLVIDNAVLNVEYASDDVADFDNNKGLFTVGVTVSF